MRLGFEPATGANPSEIAVDIELQKVGRGVARTACHVRSHTGKSRRGQIQAVDKRLNEPHRVLGTDVVIERFWKQQRLGSIVASNVRHDPNSNRSRAEPESVATQISHSLLELRTIATFARPAET